MKKNINIEM